MHTFDHFDSLHCTKADADSMKDSLLDITAIQQFIIMENVVEDFGLHVDTL